MSVSASLRPDHDWQKVVLFVLACAGAVYSFGDKIFSMGKSNVSAEKVDRLEATVNQTAVDTARAKMQSEMANAGVQQVRSELRDGLHDINEQLRQLTVTGRRRP